MIPSEMHPFGPVQAAGRNQPTMFIKARDNRSNTRPRGSRAGFTIIELGVSILVIAVLIGLLLVGLNRLSSTAQSGAERANLIAMKVAIESFKTDFGILPPLVKDGLTYPSGAVVGPGSTVTPPVDMSDSTINTYDFGDRSDADFLRGNASGEEFERFSVYSLPYYLVGVLGADYDGKEGPGYRELRRDGTFRTSGGRLFDPKFEVTQGSDGLVEVDGEEGRFELRDRNGIVYRYYRWLPDESVGGQTITEFRNVPSLLGDPADDIELRDAEYAIMAAGPNRVFGEIDTESEQGIRTGLGAGSVDAAELERVGREDNVVEVGR